MQITTNTTKAPNETRLCWAQERAQERARTYYANSRSYRDRGYPDHSRAWAVLAYTYHRLALAYFTDWKLRGYP